MPIAAIRRQQHLAPRDMSTYTFGCIRIEPQNRHFSRVSEKKITVTIDRDKFLLFFYLRIYVKNLVSIIILLYYTVNILGTFTFLEL